MRVDEAESQLKHLLVEAGIDLAVPRPAATWKIFKAFAWEPVEGVASDGLIFESGIYDWFDGKGPRFNWSFARQFEIYEEGEYDHMEQLRCDFFFEATPELEGIERAELWSFDLAPDDWITQVERLDGFRAGIDRTPVDAVVSQEAI